ncbi:cob(I)yrinic acid a,c-diamide adenosyltransferase [Candidatus Omnitrophota bacterium]
MKKKNLQQQGLTLCFTGEGKGKTTAAIGLIVRALAYKKKVLLVQFIKGTTSGELSFLKKYSSLVTIKQFGCGFCKLPGDSTALSEHKKQAEKGLLFVQKILHTRSCNYDLIILDEINLTIKLRLLKVNDVLNLIKAKKKKIHLVLTGRYASKKVTDLCDLVSDIKEVKHPHNLGVPAQPIIEF